MLWSQPTGWLAVVVAVLLNGIIATLITRAIAFLYLLYHLVRGSRKG